ncbi:protein-arginine deiminase family protein [Kribbella sp. NPDC051936]|uniref:protein-arginine deiminase family protein n=1 Tax=Kribbella sp. NPDC051936 TaxID=3154946 RepID=UPI00344A4279
MIDAQRNLSHGATGTVTVTPADKAHVFTNGRLAGTAPYQEGVPGEWEKFASTLRKATTVRFVEGTAGGRARSARAAAGRPGCLPQAAGRALGRNGVRVHWVEDFFWAHLGGGEVHCATNALRDARDYALVVRKRSVGKRDSLKPSAR